MPVFDAHMGPFGRATGKLKGPQKDSEQAGKESFNKRTSLLKDPTSEKNESTINFDAASASKGRCEIPVAKSGHSSAKSEQNKVNISGKESFHSWAKLGKELDDLIYTPGPPEKIKSKTQEGLLLANIGKSGVSVAKVDNYCAMRSKSENKIRKERVADTANSQQESAQGLWKGGERKFEETPGGGNRSWVPVAEAGKVEAASAQGLWKGGQRKFEGTAGGANRSWVPLVDAGKVEATSAHGLWKGGERKSEESAGGANKSWEPGKVEAKDSKAGFNVADKKGNLDTSSLTLSLGLNRIKTRSGPLHEGDVEGKREGDTGCSHHIDASEAKSSGHATTSSKELNNMSTNKGYPSIERGQGKLNNEFVASSRNPSGNSNTTSTEVATNSSGGIHEGRSMKLQRPSPSPRSSPQLQGCQRGLLGRGSLEGIASSSVSNWASPTSQPIDGARPKVKEHQRALQKIDHLLEKKVPCRLASLLDSDCSRNSDTDGTLKQLDVIKETELTKSEAVPQISKSIKKQKWPKDIKSFSHELGPKVGRPYGYPRPHSDNDLKELLGALRARFDTAKEEVDAELAVYAADLIEILEKNADCFLEWQEKVEDLLVLARRCAMMSPCDFRRECEGIVQEVDDKRQELPMGLLKQLHTRMLFILTRCTRLLQFQKEASPEEEGPIHKIQQCLKGVPSLEKTWASTVTKKGKFALNARKLLPEFLARFGRGEAASISRKGSKHAEKPRKLSEKTESFSQPLFYANQVDTHFANHLDTSPKSIPFAEETVDSKSAIQDLGIGDLKVDLEEKMIKTLQGTWDHMDHAESGKKVDNESQETIGQSATPSRQAQRMPWGYWTETENLIEETDLVICRICEEEVPALHLEGHSLNCALADTCDVQGSSLDERLRILADNLEKITELSTPKNYQPAAVESPDLVKALKVNLHDNITSPKLSDSHGKSVESRFEEFFASDTTGIEELRGLNFISFKPHLGPKSEQGVASSSAGSLTPRSTLTTPRTSQLDLLWAERSSLSETEDISQINELADIARCVANQSPMEEGALEYLVTCMQDLQDVLGRNKIEALTVDTFGRRIENLLREKYLLILERMDQRKSDSASSPLEDDSMSTDDGSHSLKSTPTHPAYKDRITIDDFEILKPISRGAFGRVFLARKRTTGDLFAIKVLRKIDMIRKNAVENILAERDILITVRNPFVVRFFYSFTCRDNLYLVMEYLNGGDLYSLLKNMGCLEEHVARVYIAELVLALEYLHSLGVVHRDLKPDNVLIAHDGHIKLTDFGLSNVGLINSTDDLSGPGSSGTMLTDETTYQATVLHSQQREQHRKRSAVGTPDYLAPEILLGTEHGYTADWWSTGIILFEFLTGLPPFNAEHPQMIFDNILNRKIPWPSVPEDMSHEAQDLIDRLLTEDPNQRLGSKGASEVKAHPFFKDINWDTLARQKAAFVPNPESVDDTSYFTSRHLNGHTHSPQDFADSSDCSISSASTNSLKARLEEGDDECGDLAEFEGSPSVRDTFNNFSFKNLSQLASINYDLLSQTGKDCSKGHSRRSSVS